MTTEERDPATNDVRVDAPTRSSITDAAPGATSTPLRRQRRRPSRMHVAMLVAALLGAMWFFRDAWRPRDAKRTPAMKQGAGSMEGMQGMQGMAGMSMGADGAIALTADQLRTFGVTFGDADMRTMTAAVRAAGNVMIDETRIVQVTPRVGGFVERLYVNVTGQPVRRGQPLLELYSPELLAAQQELLLAAGLQRSIGQSAVPGIPDNTTDLVAAAKRRFQLWDVSDAQVNEILRTGQTRRTMTLYAPASGVVTERTVVQGQSIMPGEKLFTIADLSRVWVEADLRGADAASVRAGTTADIEITGLGARSFTGRVEYVYPTLETDARTTRARIAVANTSGLLKPGMYATVRLSTPSRTALTVPTSAVVRTGERAFVFVDLGGGKLKSQDVELGASAGDYTEVLLGVEPGQHVVTSAQFLLDSESNLGEVMKSMMGMGGGMADMKGMDGMDMKGADTKGMKGMPMNGKR